jgi:hypothetical protein
VAIEVATPVYEGPFDLLLHLIMREEVDIHEISLSTIVDAYLTELSKMQELDLEIATEFLLIAATLIELKARRLLPGKENIDLDEELALWEERDLLLARLLECKTFKDVAKILATFVDDADRVYARTTGTDERFEDVMPDLLEGMTLEKLQNGFIRAITPRPRDSPLPKQWKSSWTSYHEWVTVRSAQSPKDLWNVLKWWFGFLRFSSCTNRVGSKLTKPIASVTSLLSGPALDRGIQARLK